MSRTQKILFFATGWLIVLMPFLFWWNTWFGRHLSDQQLNEYLHDDKKPRHIQHALVQLGDRMSHHDAAAKQWYPDLVRLADDPVEEVRNTDAWVMGQDTSGAGFHEALLKMLQDSSPMVRGNAALSLVRFGDATGRPQIVALLQPAHLTAPANRPHRRRRPPRHCCSSGRARRKAGRREALLRPLKSVRQFPDASAPSRRQAPTWLQARKLAVIDPGTEQVWEALRALYLVGQFDDLAAVRPYERDVPEISNDVRQQAVETEKAIRARAAAN